ncbi:MAG: hypothetical protein IT353_07575 [Gemmatimonadaceae bacterium]|nr:hypothetical protein [Gemmatimonadaceae bacterium]
MALRDAGAVRVISFVVVLHTTAAMSVAQTTKQPPTAAQLLRELRDRGWSTGVASIVTYEHGKLRSPADREELADSLEAFLAEKPATTAIDATPSIQLQESRLAVMNAFIRALRRAPSPESASRIGERLLRIAERSSDALVSQGAGRLLMQAPDTSQAIGSLQRLATSQSAAAERAVYALGRMMASEGQRVLERLYTTGQITHRQARWTATLISRKNGWSPQDSANRVREAVAVSEKLRMRANIGDEARLLARGPTALHSERALAVIADSITSYLVSPTRSEKEVPIRHAAAAALAEAFAKRVASDRLLVVARTARDPETRMIAISTITSLLDAPESVRLLALIASANDQFAAAAIQGLAAERLVSSGGLTALRELDRQGVITERTARAQLSIQLRLLAGRKTP